MTTLHILAGSETYQSFELKDPITYVGRAEDNDIQIKDRSISRKHVKIIEKNCKFFIEDLGSENGTWINGKPINLVMSLKRKKGLQLALGTP